MSRIYVSEFVLPGHPDKLCDAIADALVQEACQREKRALCGVEVAIHRASVFITGRIACQDAESIPIDRIARDILRSAGYGKEWQPHPDSLRVETDLCLGPLHDGEAEFRAVSDDQSIITGYAIDSPGTNFLPPEHWLAYRLSGALEGLRSRQPELLLGPDGKVAVIYEQDTDRNRVVGFSTSLQQKVNGPAIELHRAVLSVLKNELAAAAAAAISGFDPAVPDEVHVNGAGNFEVGGPEGDNGLSGKKLVVDAYGPRVPISGGALSGKDFYKADRAGGILARRLAKAAVLTGAAHECTATLAFLPGAERGRVISLLDEDHHDLRDCWSGLMNLFLAAAGDRYTGAEDLIDIARHGHFTRPEHAWEQIRLN